jgi:hypothetical protein
VRVRDPNLYHGTFPAIHDNRAIDVDSDGLVDVVFGYLADPNHTRPRLGWLKNTGERNWLDHTTLADVRPISEPGDTSAIYWVDVDNDGHMDLATSGWPLISGMVWHRHLDGLGTFASPEPLFNPSDISDWGAWKGQFVDLNGDGFPDYVVSVRGWQERDPTRDVLGWYPNQGDGTFGDFITIVSRAPSSSDVFFGRNTGAFGFGDIDGDGDLDIVAVIVVGPEVTNLYWFENQGGGSSFLRHELTNTSYSTWREMNFVIVDFNGDGDMDIIGGGLADYESYFEQRVMGDANGDGRFDSADLVQVFQAGEYEDGIHLNSTFATGDWNGDFEFTSRDLVWAFQAGNYQGAAAPALAPSPTTSMLADIAFAVQSQEQHALRVGQPLDRTRTASAKRAYVP